VPPSADRRASDGGTPSKGKTKKHQKRTNDLELAASIWPQRMAPNPKTSRMRRYLASRARPSVPFALPNLRKSQNIAIR